MLHVLYGFLFSLIMLVPSHSMGQIIIKENMDLEEQTYTGLSSVFSTSSLSALDLPSAIQYTAQSSGRLKLYLDEHIRYTKKLSENVVLEVQIKNGVKNIKKELVLSDYYDAPLTTPLWEECPETYYLFGKGPFYFNNTIESSEGGNALLKYSNIVSSHANSNYYEESLEEMVISFSRSSYEGRVIESKARSFLKFDIPTIGPGAKVEHSALQLIVKDRILGHDFGLRQVADPWSPENITWNNQPNTVGEPIIVPGNSYRSRYFDIDYYYPIDVKPLISHMIADSGKNYGIRLATGFDENDSGIITGSIKRNIFYAPGYEGFRENDRRPYLQVRFSNPSWEETIMDAGPVAEGDTVTIAYKNENPAGNRTYFSDNPYTREFNGEEYFGRYLIFYNRNFIDRCQASWPDTEDLWLFAFIEKADESPQFAVEIEPVELEYFQEGALDIKVINPNDPNEILPTDLFEFAVDEAGKSYGGFKRRLDLVSLDQPITTDTKTEQLEKIQAKEIEFFVDRASPEEPVIATITATLKKDPAQTTSTTVNIVPCEPELCPGEAMTKPQQFDAKTNTVMVQAGDTYTWTDRQGNSRSQTIPKFKTQSLGITKPLWTINDLAAPGLEFNYLTDQLNIKACKANSEDQQWNLRAENIVIPIYAEAYLQERGKIDLEDFTYQTFLREVRVQNYDHVQLDLEAFAIGSYAFRFVNEPKLPANLRKQYINPKRFAMLANGQERFVKRIPEVAIYTSRIGVMLHEEEHVRQYRKQLSIEMNRAFNEIYNNRADPLCDGDAKETVKQLLSKAEQKISDNFDRNRYLYELKADRNASRFFDSLVRKLEAHKQKAQQEGKWPQ